MDRIPAVCREAVLNAPAETDMAIERDPLCLALLKPFRSLMPLAQEARKPMFALKLADGAIGGHAAAMQRCHHDLRALALAIAEQAGVTVP